MAGTVSMLLLALVAMVLALPTGGLIGGAAAARTVRLTVVTANVGRGYKRAAAVRRNIALVLRRFRGAVIGWQEIDEADAGDEHGILASLVRRLMRTSSSATRKLARATKAGWRNVGFGQLCPISLPLTWALHSSEVKPACQGRAHKTPNRVIVIARATHRKLRGRIVSFMNGHLPFNTPDLWDIAFAAWVAAVEVEVAAGNTVVITMDSNHHGPTPQFHPHQQVLVGANGIDKVIVVEPIRRGANIGVAVTLVRRVSADLNLDGHDAEGVELDLFLPAAA